MTGEPPTVLLATLSLTSRTGTDIYTRDLSAALLCLGWRPVVYTPRIGSVAEEIRRRTIPVIDDLAMLSVVPTVIHGHHGVETLTAMATFPETPAIFVSHDAWSWHSMPPVMDRIRAYVAVDENCRDRLVAEYGVPRDRTHLLLNAIDMQRFQPRPPLPPRPARAAVFSNGAREDTFVPAIRQACAQRAIAVDVLGEGAGTATDRPESVLPGYDLVFAKGRCALEALAVGAAVIICDYPGLGVMVTASTVERLRQLNLGVRTMQRPVTAAEVGAEIDRYDPADAAAASALVRRTADIGVLATQFTALYDDIRQAPVVRDADAEALEVARYLRALSTRLTAAQPPSTSQRVLDRLRRIAVFGPVTRRLHRWLNDGA